jgi:hypothetical protein
MTNYTDFKTDKFGQYIIENDDFVLVTGNDETLQRLTNRLKVFKGEWFLNPELGLDFYNEIANKKLTSKDPAREIQRVILETEGIDSIVSFSQTVNNTNRTWSFIVTIRFDDGTENTENIEV